MVPHPSLSRRTKVGDRETLFREERVIGVGKTSMLRGVARAWIRGVGAARVGAGAHPAGWVVRASASARVGASEGVGARAGSPARRGTASASGGADGRQDVDGPVQVDPGALVDERQFESMADAVLEEYSDRIEAYLEEGDTPADVELAMGVLTVHVGEEGKGRRTFVLNKQTPNRQLWLSSPISGPWRYDCHPEGTLIGESAWVYRRDGHMLSSRLAREVPEACGTPDAPLDLDLD